MGIGAISTVSNVVAKQGAGCRDRGLTGQTLERRHLFPLSPEVSILLLGYFLFSVVVMVVVEGPLGVLFVICCYFGSRCSLPLT